MAKDYYSVLGISRDADEKAVKNAYRKLAREYHPDVNPNNPSAEAKFKEISNAFQVLSDPDKRKLYDQFGENYDKVPPGYEQYAAQGGGFSGGGYPGGGFPGGINLEDLLNQAARSGTSSGFSTGGAPGGRTNYPEGGFGGGGMGDIFGQFLNRKRAPQKGSDVEQPIDISFAEAIRGTQRSLNLTIRSDAGREERREVTVKIPALVNDGAKVRVAGKGASGPNGGPNGDLYLKIQVRPDPFWKREGQNIKVDVPISFQEAALGATIAVPTLSGEVKLKIPAGTQSGQTFRLSGRGIKNEKTGTSGDEFVTVKVSVPRHLSPREEELVRELGVLRTEDPRQGLPKALS